MLVAYAAANDLVLEGADISNAYLFGNLDVPIIMEQPTDSSQRAVSTRFAPVNPAEEASEPELEDTGSFVVDRILSLGDDADGTEPRALVKWVGYPTRDATWEPVSALDYNLVLRFCRKKGADPPSGVWWTSHA